MSANRNVFCWSLGGVFTGLTVGGVVALWKAKLNGYCEWGAKHLFEYGCGAPDLNVYSWTSDTGGGAYVGCAFNCTKQVEFNAAFSDVLHQSGMYAAKAIAIGVAVGLAVGMGIGIYKNGCRMLNQSTLFANSRAEDSRINHSGETNNQGRNLNYGKRAVV